MPVEFVKDKLERTLVMNEQTAHVHWITEEPAFELETKALDDRIKDGVQLSFITKNIAGTYYLNLSNTEKLFGTQIAFSNDTGILTITRNSKAINKHKLNTIRNTSLPPNAKINLVWDHIKTISPDLSKEATIEGLNVISPTWFSLSNGEGDINNNADFKYVNDAHAKGYKVWALVSNSFSKDLTRTLLSDITAQDNFINQLMVYSSLYNLDGINIDFENIYDTDKEKFTCFVERLTAILKQQNIVVSIDVTAPANIPYWSSCYDRTALGEIVDYVMLMAYDEHWASSPKSGSVASIGWTEKSIINTLNEIPKEKLILGIPFYTREWQEGPGNKVKARTMSMAAVEKLIAEKKLKVTWLDKSGQNYTEYVQDGKKFRIWIEDNASLKMRTDLLKKYNLPGVASWRKGFEAPQIWSKLAAELSLSETPTTIQPVLTNHQTP